MKRRSFLQAVVAVVAAPKAAPSAGIRSLYVSEVGAVSALANAGMPEAPVTGDTGWAVTRLAKLKALSALQLGEQKNRFNIHALDTDTAALRSMSLANKVRRSTTIQFNAHHRDRMTRLERIILGVED